MAKGVGCNLFKPISNIWDQQCEHACSLQMGMLCALITIIGDTKVKETYLMAKITIPALCTTYKAKD